MNDEITYIGISKDEKNENHKLKTKGKNKEKNNFKVNKRNKKVNKFISSTKEPIISKSTFLILLIILGIIIFKPITFLKNSLDKKREYYAMIQEYSAENKNYNINLNLDLNNLWNNIVFASGEEYYLKCKGTMLMPTDGKILCHYDFTHLGIDISSTTYPGNVYAATTGTVCHVGNSEKYGNEIIIEHFINGMKIYTFYGNLSQINVAEGQNVDTNTIIGIEAGNNSSPVFSKDGDEHHVHFAVRKTMKESTGLNPIIFAKYR